MGDGSLGGGGAYHVGEDFVVDFHVAVVGEDCEEEALVCGGCVGAWVSLRVWCGRRGGGCELIEGSELGRG